MIQLSSMQIRWLQSVSSRLSQGAVGLIYFDLLSLERVEELEGRAAAERLLLTCRTSLDELRSLDVDAFECKRVGDDFYMYVSLGGLPPERALLALERKAESLREALAVMLGEREPVAGVDLGFGCALLRETSERELETVIYSAMKQAIRQAKERSADPELASRMKEFLGIFTDRLISSVYQPIVSLSTGSVFGYEALTRGPEQSPLRSPLALFQMAEHADKLYAFDRLAREQAILGIEGLESRQRIFLNIPASILHDPDFSAGQTLALLSRRGLAPSNVVFEITERSSIEDFKTAKQVIDHYRRQGYRIAIDDAGAGYSSLQAIAEIQPDFIKVDRSLVSGVHRDKVKEYILETFVTFAKRLNIEVIAEGIENGEDLETLLRLGVHYSQGYYLGRPNACLRTTERAAFERIEAAIRARDGMTAGSRTILDIAGPVRSFEATVPVSEAADYFRDHPDCFGAAVVRDARPVGLLMKEELFRRLAVPYGISLFWSKPVTVVADDRPLTVDASVPVETVSTLAMLRESDKLYDLVLVTEEGRLAGAATVRDILEEMTSIRMEHARVSNPLTGLPGNERIRFELDRRIAAGAPFALLYIDLDFFKWFNDQYGFQCGDQAIRLTANALIGSVSACGHADDFVGHIGGDDFIVASSASSPETLAGDIVRRFRDRLKAEFDPASGPVTVLDRQGRQHEIEGLSISISIVHVHDPAFVTAEDVSRAAAKLKAQAKAKPGHAIVSSALPDPLTAIGTTQAAL